MKKKGLALVAIIFFGFCIAIMLYAIVQSSSNLTYETKKTIRSVQAYYLAQSAIQHLKLQLSLYPKHSLSNSNRISTGLADYFDSRKATYNLGNSISEKNSKYNIFFNGDVNSNDKSTYPYVGYYKLNSFSIDTEAEGIASSSANFLCKVEAEGYVKASKRKDDESTIKINESFVVRRYSGDRLSAN